MHDPESYFDLRRLLALAARLELHDVVTALASQTEIDAASRKAILRTTGQQLLREVAVRQAALQPSLSQTHEKWVAATLVLNGLEQMSRHEIAALDELARCTRDEARAWVAALPAAWQARCRSLIATAILADDLESLRTADLVRRLRRQLAIGLSAFGRRAALLIHHDLLRRLTAATDAIYPLARTADQMLRAMGHAADTTGGSLGASSLVDRLAARREHWLSQARKVLDEDLPDIETALEVGVLAGAMGFEIALRALETLDGIELPPGNADDDARRQKIKGAILEAARTALDREWQSSARNGLAALDAYVITRFAILQRDIDEWLEEVRGRLRQLRGHATEDTQRLEALRFELADICRRAEGGHRPQESP